MRDNSPVESQLSCYKEQTDRKMVKMEVQDVSSHDPLPKAKETGTTKKHSSDLQNSIDQEQVATD